MTEDRSGPVQLGEEIVTDTIPACIKTRPSASRVAAIIGSSRTSSGCLPSPYGHSWDAYRQVLPMALRLVAERQVQLGVFS